MAIDRDGATSLPTPPPPRPARRQAAIESALRKFDGVEEQPSAPARSGWAGSHRYQLGGLVTAALVAVIAIPTALVVLREQPPAVAPEAPAPAIVEQGNGQADALSEPPAAGADTRAGAPPQGVPSSARAPVQDERRSDAPPVALEQKETAGEAPAAYAPAAPPPPPPAPARNEAVEQADEIVLTGTRLRQPNLSKERNAKAVASPQPGTASYEAFLSGLQGAVRADDRRAIIALIGFPLRVNQSGRTRTYRSADAVARDFDRIFTSRVKRAILNQRADQLFVRDQGAMVGDGELWFDRSCRNSDCSSAGPVRILAVNP